jgi:hypothetical protein
MHVSGQYVVGGTYRRYCRYGGAVLRDLDLRTEERQSDLTLLERTAALPCSIAAATITGDRGK